MKKKLISMSMYLGGAPIWSIRCRLKGKEPSNNSHYIQVLKIQLLQVLSLLIFLVVFGVHTLIIRYSRELALKIPLEISFYILGVLLIICIIIRLEGLISAVMGRSANIKIPFKVEGSRLLKWIALFGVAVGQCIIIIFLVITIYSSTVTIPEVESADVYMLYDDMGYIPRWIFSVGFYPEIVASRRHFGEDSVMVIPLSGKSMDNAVQSGKLIYVAAHGAEGAIWFPNEKLVWPEDIKADGTNDNLQYVYLCACDSGYLHEEWEKSFESAEVITFGRLSTVLEHIRWLVFEGPKVIAELD